LGVNVQNLGTSFHFGRAALGERTAGDPPVADVTVGDGDELDMMSKRGPLRRSAGYLDFAIVGMRPERDDAELPIVRRSRRLHWLRRVARIRAGGWLGASDQQAGQDSGDQAKHADLKQHSLGHEIDSSLVCERSIARNL